MKLFTLLPIKSFYFGTVDIVFIRNSQVKDFKGAEEVVLL